MSPRLLPREGICHTAPGCSSRSGLAMSEATSARQAVLPSGVYRRKIAYRTPRNGNFRAERPLGVDSPLAARTSRWQQRGDVTPLAFEVAAAGRCEPHGFTPMAM